MPGTAVYDYCLQNGLITDEEAYPSTVSQRGDASAFHLNLTGMDDSAFLATKANGEQRLSAIALGDYLKYYGIQRGISHHLYDLGLRYRRKLLGCHFDTP